MKKIITALVGLLLVCVTNVYAGTAYTNGRAFLKQGSPTGGGKVYVASNATEPTSGQYKAVTSSTSPAFNVQVAGDATFHYWAVANPGYIFTGWYTAEGALQSSGAAHISKKVTAGQAGASDTHAYADYYASFIKQIQLSFVVPTNGSFTITHCGTEVTPAYSSFTTEGKVVLTALPADGYKLRGWYTTTNGGVTKNYFAFGNSCEPNFTSNTTIGAEFVPDDGKATFWIKGTNQIYDNLTSANTAAASSSSKLIVVVSDGVVGAGTYTISSGVTLLIPYEETYNLMTTPNIKHIPSPNAASKVTSIFRKLTLASGATINVSGNICIGGSIASCNGGSPSSFPTGSVGMLDMSRGGTINLASGSNLYAWGYVKGQDMDQGNNTAASGVGEINAASGATVWEDYQVGEWRGGTASSTIYSNKGSWKFFPFQSYSIQNIEAPVNYAYGSNCKCYWTIFGNGSVYDVKFPLIASSGSLFKLAEGGTVRKWYDPTTDHVCFEMGGTAALDALTLTVMGETVSSSDYYLPIPANLKIILKSGNNLTVSKPMTMHAGSVVEVKSGATLTVNNRVHLFDADDWDTYCMYAYYYRTYYSPSLHFNRGEGTAKTTLEDATVIVDGTVDVKGTYLYSSAHGSNICGNGGGTFKYAALPSNTTMTQCKVLKDNVSVNIRSANLHNDNDTYTKGIASTTFKNVNGRWFTNAASTIKANKTYDFTYISSGDVYGTGGTNKTVAACWSKDKTGLELQDKWANIKTQGCTDWWEGIDDGHLYNWSRNSAWHQYIKAGSTTTGTGEEAVTTETYVGSDGKMLYKTDCEFVEAGTIDGNCLYPSNKALVNGSLIAVTANTSPDHGYHKSDAASTYYLCFEGCVWHPATRNAENLYTVDGTKYIWYGDKWMAVEYDSGVSLHYSLSATNVKIYYEYVGSAWVLATPVAEVVTSAGTEQVFSIANAITKAKAGGTNVTIRLLKDISGTISYDGTNNCGLDLNGFTLSSSTSGMITVNSATATFIIKDQSAAGTGKVRLSFSANNDRRRAIYVQNGHCILNSGTVEVVNTLKYDATNETTKANTNKTYATGVYVASGKKFTMNGGVLNVTSDYNPYGINSDATAASKSVTTINGGIINVVSEVRDSPYAIFGPGTINMNGGTVNSTAVKSTTAMGIYVYGSGTNVGTLNMTGGTINASSTKSTTAIGIYVSRGVAYDTNEPRTQTAEYPCIANISGGTINATTDATTGSTTTEAVRSYGTTTITGGRFVSKPRTTTAYGVRIYTGTTTISGSAEFDVQATSKAYGISVGNEQPTNAGVVYNTGSAIVNGGTFTVKTTSGTDAYGMYVGANSRAVTTTHATNTSYYAGNYANAGTATLNDGEFVVTSATTNGYAIFVKAAVTQSGASGYASATATPKCTVNGGKYKITSTNGSAAYINNTAATLANFSMAGGYFNIAPNGTTNIASGKSVKDVDRTKEQAIYDAGYVKKIAGNEYTVSWYNYNGTTLLGTTQVESGKVPVWTGETPTYNTSTTTREFDGWSTEAKNAGTTYLDGAALPDVGATDVTYYAHYKTIYAEVTVGSTTERYYTISSAWSAAMAAKQAYIKVLTSTVKTNQLVFNPSNANSVITLDLNGHYWGMNGSKGTDKDCFIQVNKADSKLIITDNSASGNGYIYAGWAKESNLYCLKVSAGECILQGGAIKCDNTTGGYNSIGVSVSGGAVFTMTGGTVDATKTGDAATGTASGIYAYGTANVTGGRVYAHYTNNQAIGVYNFNTTGTVNVSEDAEITAEGKSSAYGFYGYGTVNVEGGTINVTATNGTARGVYITSSSSYKGTATVTGNPTFTITAPSEAYGIYSYTSGVTSTVSGGTFTITAQTGNNAVGAYANNYGEIIIEGGTFTMTCTAESTAVGAYGYNNGTVTVKGGTFTSETSNSAKENSFGVFANTGTVNVEGGTFYVNPAKVEGNNDCARCNIGASVLNISGGTFTSTNARNCVRSFGGETTITGNPVFTARAGIDAGTWASATGVAKITVDGGTFNCTDGKAIMSGTHHNVKDTDPDPAKNYDYTVTGDVLILDGKFHTKDASTRPVNTGSGTSYLTIKGGYFTSYTSSNVSELNTYVDVASGCTTTALESTDPMYAADYRYRVNTKFTVTWKDMAGNTLKTDYWNRNDVPSYGSDYLPSDGNTYTFNGWSPVPGPIQSDQVYTAQYTKWEAEVYEGENPTPKRFEHFTDAWSAAKNLPVAKVKLLSNVSMSTQLVLTPDSAAGSKPLTLDLNNHTLAYTGTTDRFVIVNKAGCVLKVADSSVANGGVLKYEGSYNGGIYTVVSYLGDIVLESGKIFAKNTYAGKSSRAVTPCATTTFTMTGGTAEAHAPTDARAIAQDGTPSVIVSGGRIIAKSYTISGDTVWGSTSYGICMGHGSLSVSGNPIITSDASASALGVYMYNSDASFEIDGGTFTSKAHNGSASYCIYTNTNSVGNIIRGGTFKAIGLNGGQIHAVHAIGSSKIDISGGTFTSHANAGQSHCLFVQSGGTLNVSGGSFTAESDAPSNGNIEAVRMWTGGVVNISGGTFTSTGASNNIALRNLGGTATISGGTFTSGNYTIGVAEAGSIGSVGDVTVNINGGTFISDNNRNIYASSNDGTTSVAVTVNGGYFHSAGTNVVEKAGTATIVLNGGKYNETSGSNHKTNITSYKGSTTTVSDISETVAGKTYVYELLTKFNISWRGGSSYTKDEQIYSGIVPTNNELVGKHFLRNDSAFYFTGWSPTPTAVAGDATYQALGEYHVAKVTVAAKDSIFDDFDEAWNYAMTQTNATITLLNNITRTESLLYIPENANARHTFDLNNFTIKENTKDRLLVVNKSDAKLTITDNSSEKGGCLYKKMNSSTNLYTTVIYHGEMILAGGKIYVENTKDDKAWHPALAVHTSVSTDGIFTMTGGTVESQAKYLAYPIYNYATTNISGGTVIANATSGGAALGLYAIAGTATISGGTFNVTASTNATGAIVTGWINNDGSITENGVLNITGGTFNVSPTTNNARAILATGTGKNIGGTIYTAHGIANISGGTFNVACPPVAAATQIFGAVVDGWRLFDGALPHTMIGESRGEMNISGGTFTIDARDNGTWVANSGNVDLLRSWGTLNVSGGNFTLHQYSTPSAISVFRGKTTVTGNPVFNVYAHTGNAYAVCAGYWTSENYCDKNAANNLAEAEVNGGTFKIITEGQNTNVIYSLGQISAESRDAVADTITAHAGYAMNAKITVNGGEFLGICPNASGKYPIMLNSREDQVGTYGTAKSEIYVTGGKFKSRKGTEADNTTSGAVNCHNNVGTLLLTGGYYETSGQLAAQKADTCDIINITSAEIDPEYNNGYRYRIDIHYVAQVTATGIDRKFATLKGALDYARTVNNSTVTILNDCDFETDGQYGYGLGTTGKTMTIDLNNHTVNATNSETSYDRVFAVTGQITITDNSVAKGGKLNLTKAHNGTFLGIVFNDASQLTLANGTIYVENTTASKAVEALNIWGTTGLFRQTGGTLQAKATSGTATGVQMRGTAQISGGNITVTSVGSTARAFVPAADAGNSKYGSITVSGTPTITVSGAGEVSGVYANVAGTTATISGGTWNITSTTSTAYGVRLSQANTATISGGTFNATATTTNAYGIYVSGGASGTVSGGTFTSRNGAGQNECFGAFATGTGTTLDITGGTFDVNSADNAGGNINVVRVQPSATVTISGGTFRSGANNGYGLVAFGGVTTVSGTALFEAYTGAYVGSWYQGDGTNDELATVNLNGGTFNVKGIAINATWNTRYKDGVYLDSPFVNSIVNVNGGRYKTTSGTIVQKKADGADGGTAVLNIAGGYFNEKSGTTFKDQISPYVADTSRINTLDPLLDGIYKYEVAPHYVAKVQTGSTTKYHTTAKAAFDYANTVANPTITLLDNCTLTDANYTINPGNWTGTLDLNNFTLTPTVDAENGRAFTIGGTGTKFIVTDNSVGQGGKIYYKGNSSVSIIYFVVASGEMELAGGTLYVENTNASKKAVGFVVDASTARFTQSGGTFTIKGAYGANGYYGGGTATFTGGTMNVDGGSHQAIGLFPQVSTSVLNVSGSFALNVTSSLADSYGVLVKNSGATGTISGGKFKFNQNTIVGAQEGASLTINGGYFCEHPSQAGRYKSQINSYKGSKVILDLDAADAEYIAGYRYLVTDDPVAKVKVGSSVTYHPTVASAFTAANAATSASTITMLKDATATSYLHYTGSHNCTLDLNGHTISYDGTTTEHRLLRINNADITFTVTDKTVSKEGKLLFNTSKAATSYGVVVIAGNFQLDAGTIEMHASGGTAEGVTPYNSETSVTINGGKVYVVTTNSKPGYGAYSKKGTTTINGGTIQVEAAGAGYGIYYSAGITTVTDGKFNISGSTAYATNLSAANANMIIQGGWYNTNTYLKPNAPYQVLSLADQSPYLYEVAEAYTLTWTTDGDPLTGSYTSGLTKPGTTITAPNTPTKTGYTFSAWTPAVAATMPAANTEYTATWTINSYDVTFNMQGHGAAIAKQTIDYNGLVTEPATPTEANYVFGGWYKEAGCTNAWNFATDHVTAATTLYAKWTVAVASVTIGGATTYYDDFADAWEAANLAKGTVTLKLLQNVEGIASSLTYTNAQNCTLDLNGDTLSGTVTKLIDINATGKTFTIDDSSAEKEGKISMITSENERVYSLYITAGTVNLKHGTIYSQNTHVYSSASANKNSAATAVYVTAGQTFTMDDGTVESESQYSSIAIYSPTTGTTPITINNGLVKGHTTASTTAIGISTYGKNLTVNGGTIIGHAWISTAYGIYVRGSATLNGGRIEATNDTISNKGTTTTYGVYARGPITVPAESTVEVIAKSRTNNAYAINVYSGITGNTIAGGTFTAIAKTGKTVAAIVNAGEITVSGGKFNATAKTSAAYGIYSTRGTVTVNGSPIFNVTAGTTTAYGAYAYGTIGAKGSASTKFSGTIEINGGTFNVTSTTTTAYGAYARLASLNLTQKTEVAGDTIFGQHYMPGIIRITNGTFNVTATTNTAYGVVVEAAKSESGFEGAATRIPSGTITGGKFKVVSTGDATKAYAVNTSASNTALDIQGGYYNINTNLSGYVATTKSCNYYCLETTAADKASVGSDYNYKVAEAYTLTWNLDGGTVTTAGTGAAVDATGTPSIPWGVGDAITAPTVTKTGYTFASWSPAVAGTMPAANTTYTATWTEAVASVTVGGSTTYYTTLNAAFDYAKTQNNAVVTLLKNVVSTSTYTWAPSSAISNTFDLNGHSLSSTTGTVLGVGTLGATLTIKDTPGGGSISYSSTTGGWSPTVHVGNGKLILQSGTISRATDDGVAVGVQAYTTGDATPEFEMTGGKIQTSGVTYAYAVLTKSTGSNYAETTISGGEVSASATGNYAFALTAAYKGEITVKGTNNPKISATDATTGTQVARNEGDGAIFTIEGGLFKASLNKTPFNGTVSISGGYFNEYGSTTTYKTAIEGCTSDPKHPIELTAAEQAALGEGGTDYKYKVVDAYTLTWTTDGDALTGTYTSGMTAVGASITAPNTPTKTGYTFAGWSPAVVSPMPEANKTYTATWTPTTYTLSYDLDGGSVASENPTSYTIESSAITLNNPTKAGYVFAGWTGTGLASATMTVTIPAGSTGNRSYTATWDEAEASVADGGTTTYYTTLAAAVAAANATSGATVTMLKNASTNEVEIKAAMTIDLNGKTISSTQTDNAKGVFKMNASGKTLTLRDSGTGGKIDHTATISGGSAVGIYVAAGSLRIESGIVYAKNPSTTNSSQAFGIATASGCGLTMTGGTVTAEAYKEARGLWLNGTTSLTNATITSTSTKDISYAIQANSGTALTVHSGTYTATGTTGYAVRERTGATASIEGGRFNGSAQDFYKEGGTASITGGYYVHDTNIQDNCADNYYVVSTTEEVGYNYKVAEVANTGFYADIVDVDNTNSKLILNVTGWASGGWPYTINGVEYQKTAREADRTLKVPYTGTPGDNFVLSIQKTGGDLVSSHIYVIPQEITSNTTLSADETKNLYVKGATLTVNGTISAQNIYVAPDATLTINTGKTLTADSIFLRTTASSAAQMEKNGAIAGSTKVVYTRIIKDKDFHFFGLPLNCAISAVKLSDGVVPQYGSGWLLRSYSESRRAESGADDNNWVSVAAGGTISGGKGYEMYSASNYYREFYFPVDLSGLTTSVPLEYSGVLAAGKANAGWNALVSPLTKTYENEKVPEGLVVGWYRDGWYEQEIPEKIPAATAFVFQTDRAGVLSFEGSSIVAALPRRATNEETRIQWLNVDLEDADGVGDQTSIYAHPTRYEQSYKAGIDVAKQSFEASRAILYSSHAYGEMAFAGVADSVLESGVALTIYSPKEQELTFSMRENDWLNRMEYVWLIDHETGAATDLLYDTYTFSSPAGTTRGRFTIQGVFKAPQITTDLEPTSDSSLKGREVRKVLIDQKMYILLDGVLYDATGKRVNK